MSGPTSWQVRTVMRCFGAMAAALLLSGPAARAAEAPRSAEAALAMRFCDLAQLVAMWDSPMEVKLRQCAALLEAARISDPSEPRYPRLLAEARTKAGDIDGATEVLLAFRKLRPADQGAQLELIALYLARMQSVDQKVNYLSDLIGRDSIPPEVRSELASQCAALLLESGKDERAKQMTERALSLNGLNLRALLMKSEWLNNGPVERAAIWLQMLRSNPMQGDVVLWIARLTARSGLVKDAADWYERCAFMRPPHDVLLEFVSVLLLNEETGKAEGILDALITVDPQYYEAMALRILMERRSEKKDEALLKKLKAQARSTLLNRLAVARREMGVVGAATRPVTTEPVELPDLSGDGEWALKASSDAKDGYVRALGDLAWFEIYFNDRTDEGENLLKILSQVAKETDPLVARLGGWIYLKRDRKEEAKVKLSAAAGAKDPLAALGLIRLYSASPEDQIKAKSEAQRLLASVPAGPLAALLYDGVRDLGVKVVPGADAAALKKVLDAFPTEVFNILVRPETFYSIGCEPVKISHGFGEPLMVRVTIRNLRDFDLTIGEDGVIKPALWIDAELKGARREVFAGTCIERLTDQLVLRPRQSISRVVRVDQNRLLLFLRSNPVGSITLGLTVRTNVLSAGGIAPCGYASTSSLMERSAFAVSDGGLTSLVAAVALGNGEERIRCLELAAMVSQALRTDKENELKVHGEALRDAVRRAQRDPQASVSVRTWATYVAALTSDVKDQAEAVERLLKDPAWQGKLLGLALASSVDCQSPTLERRKALVAEVAEKAQEPFVREFAEASVVLLARSPSTQAATQPATRPAVMPMR